ncbi:MAG: hypothetical protein AAF567_24520 [Actinomycetota bacterium]
MTDLTLPELPSGSLRDQLSKRVRRTQSVWLANDPADADKLTKARQKAEEAQLGAKLALDTTRLNTLDEVKAALAGLPGWAAADLEPGEDEERRETKMRRISLEVAIELDAKATDANAAANKILDDIDVWEFTFRSIGFKRRKALEDEAPPTDEEIEEAKANQRAIAELNRNMPRERQMTVPRLPVMSLADLALPLIEESLHQVRRWPDGKTGQPIEFAEAPDRALLDTMFDEFGWTAADQGALFDAAWDVDVQGQSVSWEAVGKG